MLLVPFLTTTVHAQITPLDDAYTDTAKPTTNYGKAITLDVAGSTQTAYITFDLTSIPSGYTGSSVAKASLKLYVNTVTTAGSFNVDYVNGSWTEATIDASNAPPPGATIAASVPLVKAQALDYVVIDITPAVQAWLNGTEPNYGIALVANSTFAATFDSKESKTQSHPPELDLVFAGGGTITGVPKVRCMEIIDEIEPVARGPYTGSIGYISNAGDMDLNIIIRTFVIKDRMAHVQVGAGIVADSDPEREYYETLQKAEALKSALERL
jgi:hypothetical protein